ncbi:MAG TPA: Nif3-like dinuclear metal center hexameric protein [candidate division Zixibacteria bacterium]|nr:Nif3-like dinuclear metal center hexameric protein [candidate division Zixibacteria bacterium]
MSQLISVLENIRNNYCSNECNETGLMIGDDWLENLKIKKCLITSHLTRKVVANAKKEEFELIVTIFPPKFVTQRNKISKEKMELISILINNKIAVYSLGSYWLTAEDGGFQYFLELLDFQYSKDIEYRYYDEDKRLKIIHGRLGERKTKCKFKELVDLVQNNLKSNVTYIGFDNQVIEKAAVFLKLDVEETLESIIHDGKIDALIIGDVSYELLLSLNLKKIPVVITSRRVLENILLGKIRRMLMEDMNIDLQELTTLKQDEIGVVYPK